MTFVTIFRRVPRPITGMIGILQDPEFERFEANLDWLETTASSSSSSIRPWPRLKLPSVRRFSRCCPPRETVVCR